MNQLLGCDISRNEQIIDADDDAIIYWVQPQCQINLWLPVALSAICFLLLIRYTFKPKPEPTKPEAEVIKKPYGIRDYCSFVIVVLIMIEMLIMKMGSELGLNFYSTYLITTLINQIFITILINKSSDSTADRVTGNMNPAISWRFLDILVIFDLPVQSMILMRWLPIKSNSINSPLIRFIFISFLTRLMVTGARAYYQQAQFIKNQPTTDDSNLQDSKTKPTEDTDQTDNPSSSSDDDDDDDETVIERQIFDTLCTMVAIVRPHINYATMSLIFGVFVIRVVEGILNPLGPLLAKKIFDHFTTLEQGEAISLPYYVWFFMFLELIHKSLTGYQGVIRVIKSWATTPIGNYIECELSHAVMTHIHKLSIDYHLTIGSGKLESIMERGISNINKLVRYFLFEAFPQMMNLLCSLTLAYNLFDQRYYILLGFSAILQVIMTYTIEEHYYLSCKVYHDSYDEFQSILTDSLTNFESVKLFTNDAYEATRYKEALNKSLVGGDNTYEKMYQLESLKGFMTNIITFLVSGLCAYDVTLGKRSVSDLVLLNAFIYQIDEPIRFLAESYQIIIRCLSAIEKLVTLIQEQPSVQDPADNRELVLDEKSNTEIIFDKVTFGYKKEGATTLKEISFKIPSGKVAALVGPSGGGKSTIMKLLLRWYDPQSGSISIGGQRIDQVTQDSLRKIIGVVPQDTALFNDTIAYNIKYGNLDASSEDVIEASKLAQIHDRIESFTEKYDTKVGERGLRLSGGEKQRVAIARAFIRKPSVILLDEATSALDTETERKLQKSLNQLTENRTTLIIAHRLSTIIHADVIFCIQDGAIAEQGTHQELLALGGVYAKMWQESIE